MEKQKITKEELDLRLLKIVHDLRPNEEIVIRKNDHGGPRSIIIFARQTTILDYDLTEIKE